MCVCVCVCCYLVIIVSKLAPGGALAPELVELNDLLVGRVHVTQQWDGPLDNKLCVALKDGAKHGDELVALLW